MQVNLSRFILFTDSGKRERSESRTKQTGNTLFKASFLKYIPLRQPMVASDKALFKMDILRRKLMKHRYSSVIVLPMPTSESYTSSRHQGRPVH